MTTRMEDLQSKLARVQREIEGEKTHQSINRSLRRIAQRVGATLISGVKDEGLNTSELDGKSFHCQVESNGDIKISLKALTQHNELQLTVVTAKAPK